MIDKKFALWYFEFEGEFLDSSPQNSGMALFSSCVIPKEAFEEAEELFLVTLKKKSIVLFEITEKFVLSEETVDLNNKENEFWIEWITEALLLNEPVFEEMFLYPKDAPDARRKNTKSFN